MRTTIALLTLSLLVGAPALAAPPDALAGAGAPCPFPRVDGPYRHPSAQDRAALFECLVDTVTRFHVASPAISRQLGRTIESGFPSLRAEFVAANSAALLGNALRHFANNLHDVHVHFDAARELAPGARISLPVHLGVEWINGTPSFFVASKAAEGPADLMPGDRLIEVDGAPLPDGASGLWAFESSAGDRRRFAEDIANFLTWRRDGQSQAVSGSATRWKVRRRNGSAAVEVAMTWRSPESGTSGPPGDDKRERVPDYRPSACPGLPAREMAPYVLQAVAGTFCFYTASSGALAPYPLVRYRSFSFAEDEELLAEHRLMQLLLSGQPGARAVLLDLRDNGGGRSPDYFLDWWATGPWRLGTVATALDPALRDQALRARTLRFSPWEERELAEDLAGPPARFGRARRCSVLRDSEVSGNVATPRHRVTTLPVALIVGPGCASACSSFAASFADDQLGPLVGEPMIHTTAVQRFRLPLIAPNGQALGTLVLIASESRGAVDGRPTNGEPVPVELVETSFETLATATRRGADAARAALARRKP